MSDYTVTTDFAAKDALAPGNPSKVIKGTEFDVEFDAIAAAVATKSNIASPTFTGTPAAPTAAVDTNTTQIATTAYVIGQSYLKSATAASTYAPIASPTFTGTPAAPTAAVDTNTTQIATTAYVIGQGYLKSATAAATYSVIGHTHSYLPLTGGTLTGALSGTTGAFSGAVTAASFQTTSSRELKQDIRPVKAGALARVLGWRVNEYAFKATPAKNEIGLIAEDSDPRISTGKTIDNTAALFELAAAVQELARKVH